MNEEGMAKRELRLRSTACINRNVILVWSNLEGMEAVSRPCTKINILGFYLIQTKA